MTLVRIEMGYIPERGYDIVHGVEMSHELIPKHGREELAVSVLLSRSFVLLRHREGKW